MTDYRLEESKQLYEEFLGLINRYISLERWGFVQTYSLVVIDVSPNIVYDSECCRVRFSYEPRDHGNYQERIASVWYGRLHATNDDSFINLKGKKAKSWHGIWNALDFLDSLSPQDVVDRLDKGIVGPRLIREFQKTYPSWELWGDPRTVYAIKDLRMHNEIWEHYGQKLFDIFDLRNPELWEKYVQFHNEIKRLRHEAWKAKEKFGKPFKQFDDFVPDELW